jgi:hypothetical protein
VSPRSALASIAVVAMLCGGAARPAAADEMCGRRFDSLADLRLQLAGERNVEALPVGPTWSSFADRAAMTVWTFAEAGNPAAPAVVCRRPVEENGFVSVQMQVRCRSSKAACDAMVAAFKALPVR